MKATKVVLFVTALAIVNSAVARRGSSPYWKLKQFKKDITDCKGKFLCGIRSSPGTKCRVECIEPGLVCDKTKQCSNNADEATCPVKDCGKKAFPEPDIIMPRDGPDVVDLETFKQVQLDKTYSGVFEMRGATPHFNFEVTINTIMGETKRFSAITKYDAPKVNPVCQLSTGFVNTVGNGTKAVFQNSITELGIFFDEVVFSSCPERYLWSIACFQTNVTRCPLEQVDVLLRVLKQDGATDDLPLQHIVGDLERNLSLKYGKYTNLKSLLIFGENVCA